MFYEGTLSPDSGSEIATVTENLSTKVPFPLTWFLSLPSPSPAPVVKKRTVHLHGSVQLLFRASVLILKYSPGGTDSSLYTGSIIYTYALENPLHFYIYSIYIALLRGPYLQTNTGVSIHSVRNCRHCWHRCVHSQWKWQRSYTDWQWYNSNHPHLPPKPTTTTRMQPAQCLMTTLVCSVSQLVNIS